MDVKRSVLVGTVWVRRKVPDWVDVQSFGDEVHR